jgi:MFS family permease
MGILVGLVEKMAERFLPIYLPALGGVKTIGLLNAMDNLLSALYSYPGSYLSDRFGYKKALFVFNLISMFWYLIVIFFPYWLGRFISGFSDGISRKHENGGLYLKRKLSAWDSERWCSSLG